MTAKRCAARFPPVVDTLVQRSDSVVEKITYRDVPVYLLGDSVHIHDTLPCPDANYHGHTKGRIVNAEVIINKGVLDVKCSTDSLITALARLSDTLREVRNSKTVTVRVTRTVPQEVVKYRIPAFFWYLLAFNVVYFGIKYYSPIKGFTLLKFVPFIRKVFQ